MLTDATGSLSIHAWVVLPNEVTGMSKASPKDEKGCTLAGLHAAGLQDGDHEGGALLLHIVLGLHIIQELRPSLAAILAQGILHANRGISTPLLLELK